LIAKKGAKKLFKTKFIWGFVIAALLLVATVQPVMACTNTDSGTQTVGKATKLAFIQQPTNTFAGAHISSAVTVAVEDAYGHVVTGSSLAITVAIGNNPAGGKLSGTASVNAVQGMTTFANLSIDKAGKGYTLKVSAYDVMTATSNCFNVTPVTTTMPLVTTKTTTTTTTTVVTHTTTTTTPVDTDPNSGLLQMTITGLTATPSPVLIGQGGYIHGNYELKSADGAITIELTSANGCWNANGLVLTSIDAGTTISPPAADGDGAVVCAYTFGPSGAQFNPALTLTLNYGAVVTNAGVSENSLYAAGWDGTQWQALSDVIDTTQKTITIQISHFSTYAIIGQVLPPAPIVSVTPPVTTEAVDLVTPSTTAEPETTPSSSTIGAAVGTSQTAPTTTQVVIPQVNGPTTTQAEALQVQAPNTTSDTTLAVTSQSHSSWGLILIGIAAGIALITLLIAFIAGRRRTNE
jgi:hypothetical protein